MDLEKELEIIMGTYLEIDDEDNITGFNFDKAIKDIKILFDQALSSQLKEVLGVIESKRRKTDMSIYEGTNPNSKELPKISVSGALNKTSVESYNKALDDLKAEVEKLNN